MKLSLPWRFLILVALGCVTGIIVAMAAVGFVELVAWFNDLLRISPRSRMLVEGAWWLPWATVLVPTFGGFLVGWICLRIPSQRPNGPPDTILTAQGVAGPVCAKTGILSTVAASLSLGVGASVGQYGPLVYMGASLGAGFTRLIGVHHSLTRIGIGCGAAAAIATAFNAPIAGLVFAHEVILRHYSLRAFAPISLSAILGYLVSNKIFATEPLLRISQVEIVNPLELAGFILIGIVGALIAIALMKSVLFAAKCATALKVAAPWKTAFAGMVVGLVALQIPEVLGIGKEVLRFAIIEDAFSLPELGLVMVAKLGLTALCLGFGFAGGIFSPSLLIGILFGAMAGTGAEWVFGQDHSHIAIYGICGLVAVTSPVIGAPLTTILIVFELTRNYDVTIAAMVSVAFANLVSYRAFGRSLFDVQLARRGIDLKLGRDKLMVEQRKIGEYLDSRFTSLSAGASLDDAKQTLLREGNNEAYIVDAESKYLGTITLLKLIEHDSSGDSMLVSVQSIATPEKLVLDASQSVWEAMELMQEFVGESIPVVSEGKLRGIVFESSIVSAYLGTLKEIRREEHAAI